MVAPLRAVRRGLSCLMSLNLLFWVLYVVGVVFGVWAAWPLTKEKGTTLLFWVLIGLLGWAVFGAAVHR